MRLTILILCLFVVACSSEEIERQVRTDTSRPGKVGALAGLIVMSHAHAAALEIATQADPRCGDLGPSRQQSIEIKKTHGAANAVWREERMLHSANGQHYLESTATFETEIGQTGARNISKVWADDWVYAAENSQPAYRRVRRRSDDAQWLKEGPGLIQIALDAVPGWQASAQGFELGEDPLRCEDTPSSEWLTRLATRGKVIDAGFVYSASEERRQFKAKWVLDNSQYLTLTIEERVIPAIPIEIPTDIVVVRPESSLKDAQRVWDQMLTSGVVEEKKP